MKKEKLPNSNLNSIDLSISIISWNVRELLRKCLNSVVENTRNLSYEIIVVDNASEDGTVSMIRQEFPTVQIIANSSNVGFPKANNQALKFARGRNVLFLNPDTEVSFGSLKTMVNFIDSNEKVGAVGCKLIYPDGKLQDACARSFPTPFNQFYHLAMLTKLFPKNKYFGSANLSYWDHNDTREVECLSGACLMVKKEVLDIVGGFSEDFFMYAEDIDLCYRIKQIGYKIYYIGEVVVVHHEGKSSEQKWQDQRAIFQICEAKKRFMEKFYGVAAANLFKILVVVGALCRISVIVLLRIFERFFPTLPIRVTEVESQRYINYLYWGVEGLVVKKSSFQKELQS